MGLLDSLFGKKVVVTGKDHELYAALERYQNVAHQVVEVETEQPDRQRRRLSRREVLALEAKGKNTLNEQMDKFTEELRYYNQKYGKKKR